MSATGATCNPGDPDSERVAQPAKDPHMPHDNRYRRTTRAMLRADRFRRLTDRRSAILTSWEA